MKWRYIYIYIENKNGVLSKEHFGGTFTSSDSGKDRAKVLIYYLDENIRQVYNMNRSWSISFILKLYSNLVLCKNCDEFIKSERISWKMFRS